MTHPFIRILGFLGNIPWWTWKLITLVLATDDDQCNIRSVDPLQLNICTCTKDWRKGFAGSRGECVSLDVGWEHVCISLVVKTSDSVATGWGEARWVSNTSISGPTPPDTFRRVSNCHHAALTPKKRRGFENVPKCDIALRPVHTFCALASESI